MITDEATHMKCFQISTFILFSDHVLVFCHSAGYRNIDCGNTGSHKTVQYKTTLDTALQRLLDEAE